MSLPVRMTAATLLLLGLMSPALSKAQNAAQVYDQQCSLCHGKDGAGRTAAATHMKIPDLRAKVVQDLTEEQLFDTIANGTGHKQYPHAFARRGIPPATIHDLVAHLRELSKSAKK